MDFSWLLIVLLSAVSMSSTLSSAITSEDDDALSAHYRALRQDDGQTTPLPTIITSTADQTPMDMMTTKPRPMSAKLVKILAGTLVSMVVGLGVVTAMAVIWGCKMNRRRRIQRDLVERTKHDIFEGLPNVISGAGGGGGGGAGAGAGDNDAEGDPISIPMHTVINLSLNATESIGFEVMHGQVVEEEEEEGDQ